MNTYNQKLRWVERGKADHTSSATRYVAMIYVLLETVALAVLLSVLIIRTLRRRTYRRWPRVLRWPFLALVAALVALGGAALLYHYVRTWGVAAACWFLLAPLIWGGKGGPERRIFDPSAAMTRRWTYFTRTVPGAVRDEVIRAWIASPRVEVVWQGEVFAREHYASEQAALSRSTQVREVLEALGFRNDRGSALAPTHGR